MKPSTHAVTHPWLRPWLPPLLPVLIAALIVVSHRAARAESGESDRDSGPPVPVPALHITHLTPVAGKFLNVFYVSAREAAVGVSGQRLQVHAILSGPARVRIPENGVIDLPAVKVPRSGFKKFNYLYFAVTGAEPDPLFLRNADNSPVQDPRATPDELKQKPDSSFQAEHTGFVSARALDRLKRESRAVVIDMAKDVRQ